MTYSADATHQYETHAVGRSWIAMATETTATGAPGHADDNFRGWQAAKARSIRINDFKVTLDPGAPQPNQPPPADAGAAALASA